MFVSYFSFTPLPILTAFLPKKIRLPFLRCKNRKNIWLSYRFLPHFTDFYRFLPHFTVTYGFLPILTDFYRFGGTSSFYGRRRNGQEAAREQGRVGGRREIESWKLKIENWKLRIITYPATIVAPLSRGDGCRIRITFNFQFSTLKIHGFPFFSYFCKQVFKQSNT